MYNLILGFIGKYGLVRGFVIYFKIKIFGINKIRLPDIKYPIVFRNKTTDVSYTLKEVFLEGEYDIQIPFEPEFIIDGGANTGFASVFFANKYPKADILSIEPEENNYKYLSENTSLYPNIKPIKSAIWSENALLEVIDNGNGLNGFIVKKVNAKSDKSFTGVSIKDLISGHTYIDILKLDIEGSEKVVFEQGYEKWLPFVKCLIIELHDRMVEGCSKSVFDAVGKYNFSCQVYGDNLLFINESLVFSR